MKIGDKVICVDDSSQMGDGPGVVHGEIYTVRGFRPSTGGVYLEEIELEMQGNEERAFFRWRFRVLETQWAEEVLNEIVQLVEREELVEV